MGKPTAPTLSQTTKPGYNRHPILLLPGWYLRRSGRTFLPSRRQQLPLCPQPAVSGSLTGILAFATISSDTASPPYCGVTRGPALSSPGRCQLRPRREPEVSPLPIGMSPPPNRCQRRSGEPGPFPSLATVRWHQEHGVRRNLPKQKL